MSTRAPDRPLATTPDDRRSPAAARLARPRWLDARLLVGLLLVLGSVLVGTRVVAAADDTVAVWAARSTLAPGQALTPAALEPRQVRLDDTAGAYVAVGPVLPADWVLTRTVAAGELLPRAALQASGSSPDVRYVTVAVPRDEMPYATEPGSRVEVWTAPSTSDRTASGGPAAAASTARGAAATGAPRLLLGDTTVQEVVRSDSAFGSASGAVPVVLAVRSEQVGRGRTLAGAVADILEAARSGRLYLVGLPAAPR